MPNKERSGLVSVRLMSVLYICGAEQDCHGFRGRGWCLCRLFPIFLANVLRTGCLQENRLIIDPLSRTLGSTVRYLHIYITQRYASLLWKKICRIVYCRPKIVCYLFFQNVFIFSYYLHSNATISDFLNPAVFDSLQFVINKVKDAVEGSRPRSFWISKFSYLMCNQLDR